MKTRKPMTQDHPSTCYRTLRRAAVIVAEISVLVAASFLVLFIRRDLLPTQFDYRMEVYPASGSVQQGSSLQITLDVTYLQGTPETVALRAYGGPDGTTYTFLNQTGTPTPNASFTSNLAVKVPASGSTGVYHVNVTSAAENGKTYSALCELLVMNADINVAGSVTVRSSEPIYPTEIQFINTATNQTYTTIVITKASSPPAAVLIQKGTYSILLPNHQSYRVTCTWTRLFGPWISPSDAFHGTFDAGILSVDCGVGVTSMAEDYSG
jgi:hypothetical protein